MAKHFIDATGKSLIECSMFRVDDIISIATVLLDKT